MFALDSPTEAEEEPDDLLLFTPVPLARVRARGWSAERQRAFIAALARTGVVRFAAASVGMSARSAYQLRDRADLRHPFCLAWDEAMDRARDAATGIAYRSLLEPQTRPIVGHGRILGWKTHFDDRLALAALKASAALAGPPIPALQRRIDRRKERDRREHAHATEGRADAQAEVERAAAASRAARECEPEPPPPRHPRTGRALEYG